MDIDSLAGLLHETAEHHDPYEKTHAPHNWWDWYAAYMDAREHGGTPEDAVVVFPLGCRCGTGTRAWLDEG